MLFPLTDEQQLFPCRPRSGVLSSPRPHREPALLYGPACPKAAVAARTQPRRRSPREGGKRLLPPELWPRCRLSVTPSTAPARSCVSSAGRAAVACHSPSLHPLTSPALGWDAFPITGFARRVPRARSHVPAFWTEVHAASRRACADPVPTEGTEGAQVKPRPGRLQRPARSWGRTAGKRAAHAGGRAEECGNPGEEPARARLSHIWKLPGHGLSCVGRGKSGDALRQGRAAALLRTGKFQLPAPASLQQLWRGFRPDRESLD